MQTTEQYDPTSRTASSWSSRLAAFKSRSVPDDDPRVAECQSALSFWRMKSQIDRELKAGRITPSFHAAVVRKLLDGEPDTRRAAAR